MRLDADDTPDRLYHPGISEVVDDPTTATGLRLARDGCRVCMACCTLTWATPETRVRWCSQRAAWRVDRAVRQHALARRIAGVLKRHPSEGVHVVD